MHWERRTKSKTVVLQVLQVSQGLLSVEYGKNKTDVIIGFAVIVLRTKYSHTHTHTAGRAKGLSYTHLQFN